MTRTSVYCLKYGEGALPESMVFPFGSNDRTVPISFAVYLVRTKNKNILIDAGCDGMTDFEGKNFRSPAVVLKEIAGIGTDEVTDVIITHSHFDHIEALKHFKNATLHITKIQYENGREHIPASMSVSFIEGKADICTNVKIKEMGGHCVGSVIVELEGEKTTHVFCGDECYTDENIERKIPSGISADKRKSLEFVQKYSDKKYTVHTCHDVRLKSGKIV